MSELPKTFDPAAIEARWYQHWEGTGAFRPERPHAQPFTIVMPPPNVTGSLHIGHALDITLQDVLVRHARLQGRDALYVVGTDHAGIATQMVVERNLESQGVRRTDMPRETFVEHVWEWKRQSGGQITRQLRRLGASCDWSNERFTMDPGFARAVRRAFVELHARGLIYRDKRLVNWDPRFRTAISDLEVETREVQGKFYRLSYPLDDGSGAIEVATTRPETMLADMAVAVHPDDKRYRALVGGSVRLPITGRLIPIVADQHADPELGSGAVKITPGHDFNDFEVGRRAGFEASAMLNMFDADARVVQCGGVPDELLGRSREEARARVIEMLEADGALVSVEDRTIQLPYGDRSGVVIEPWLTDQWYVDAAGLAGPALQAARDGRIRIVPETWRKTWDQWLENIQPWCISRQLWWGHQIPAWFGPKRDGEELDEHDASRVSFVAESEDELLRQAGAYYGCSAEEISISSSYEEWQQKKPSLQEWAKYDLYRDPDVLDTWFSSGLWPFGTLGWPEDSAPEPLTPSEVQGRSDQGASTSLGTSGLLHRHYPNDVLISGFDILFFWDARMAMMGTELMGEVPWRTLYLHGLVRDAQGQKMSKSKGNTVDPLGLIERYGADALRFTMAAMESQGRDIKLDEKRVEGYRNFATKLWNAVRFAQANGIGASRHLEPPPAQLAVNRWMIGQTVKTIRAMDLAFADLRFDEAAGAIYRHVWDGFCDWYLELIKGAVDDETRAVAGWALDQILVLLHPFMPFITEELWHAQGERPYPLIHASWPMADARALCPDSHREIEGLIRLVTEVRSARTELNVPPGARLPGHVAGDFASLQRQAPALARLARVDPLTPAPPPPGAAAQVLADGIALTLPLEGVIDIAAERARLEKAAAQAEKERDGLAGRLANPGFTERAKPEAVAKAREDHAARSGEAERYRAALSRLG